MANANFIVQNGLNVGGASGAIINFDSSTGSITLAAAPTAANTNPVAIVISQSGTISTVATTAGVASASDIGASANTASATSLTTFANVAITGNITANSTGYLKVPAGTNAQRPSNAFNGMMRYNSDITSFEGYYAGAWSSLGGVKSVDGKAYITAEASAGAGDDVIRVYAGDSGTSTQVMWASTSNINIRPTTSATSTSTGALQVAGGASVAGNLYIGGNLVVANLITVNTEVVTQTEIIQGNIVAAATTVSTDVNTGALVVKGGAGVSGAVYTGSTASIGGNVTITAGGGLTTSQTTAYVFNETATTINFGAAATTMNVGSGSGTWNLAGIAKLNGNVVAASTTASTSATTGALVVTGGVGISGNVFTSGWIVPTSNVSQNLGSTTSWWNIFYGKSTQAQYADLAENYQANAAYQAGQVLEFGGTAEVTLASPDTKRVAGVVSTNPAHLMNGGLQGSNVIPLALQGRVPCNVIGPVAKGDLMVSAGFGYAKPNNNAQVGQVIGKALADFSGAKGQVEVVVGRA